MGIDAYHSLTHSTLLLLYFYSNSTLLCPTIISSSSFVARSSTPSLVPGQVSPAWPGRFCDVRLMLPI